MLDSKLVSFRFRIERKCIKVGARETRRASIHKLEVEKNIAFHPKRDRGYEALREAYDTLTDANGRRDAYIREVAERTREKERLLASAAAGASSDAMGGGSSGGGGGVTSGFGGARAAATAAAAVAAAEMEESLGAKRKRMLLEQKRRLQPKSEGAPGARPSVGPSAPPAASWRPSGPSREGAAEEDDDDDDDDGSAWRGAAARPKDKKQKPRMKRAGRL